MIDPQLIKTDLEIIETNLKKRDLKIDLQNLKKAGIEIVFEDEDDFEDNIGN